MKKGKGNVFVGYSLLLFVMSLHTTRAVIILSPSSCELLHPSESLSLTLQVRMDRSLLIGVTESGVDDVYLYDIPPTPYSGKVFRLCWKGETPFLIERDPLSSECSSVTVSDDLSKDLTVRIIQIPHDEEAEIQVSLPIVVKRERCWSVWVKEIGETTMWSLPPPPPSTHTSDHSIHQSVAYVLLTSSEEMIRGSHMRSSIQRGLKAKHDDVAAYLQRRRGKEMDISSKYVPRDRELFSLSMSDVLNHDLYNTLSSLSDMNDAEREKRESALLHLIREEDASGVYSFPLFQETFAERLIQEIEYIESIYPHLIERPNSMNNYGMVIQEFRLRDFFDRLRHTLTPLFRLLFGEWVCETEVDSQHAFVVEYAMERDRDLGEHMDESLITVNVNLGKEFEGGDVVYKGVRTTPKERKESIGVEQRRGGRDALIHVGQTWHSAETLRSGERVNLIMWWRSFASLQSPSERFTCHCQSSKFGESERQLCVLPKMNELERDEKIQMEL